MSSKNFSLKGRLLIKAISLAPMHPGHFHKTRLAPTPSGYLHIGNALSFALTAALAHKTGAGLLLRIDDMDRERLLPAYVQDVFDTLRFLQINWNEGPRDAQDFEQHYSQLHRLPLYQQALEQLQQSGLVYACSCSRTQILQQNASGVYMGTCRHKGIALDAPNVSWRINTSAAASLRVKNLGGNFIEAPFPADMQDFVVRKKDGYPAYQICSLVDDVHFGIDLIVRGQDLWPSTLAQLFLAQVLDKKEFLNTTFYHHALLLGDDARKLSKSAGDTSLQYLRQHGATSADVYAQLGNQLNIQQVQNWQDLAAHFLSLS